MIGTIFRPTAAGLVSGLLFRFVYCMPRTRGALWSDMGKTGPKYHGPLGRTSRQRILYLCSSNTEVSVEVFTQINAQTDPELADELLAEIGPLTIEDPTTGEANPLHLRRVFHKQSRP